jgi:multidrug transporter EmrE-like cation transporter
MNLYYNILAIILAIFAALPVIVIKQFFNKKLFTLIPSLMLIFELLVLTIIIFGGYSYFIYKNISIAQFYPVVKMIEILVPVITGIIFYKEKLSYINYFGLFLTGIAIICMEM